ncbi:hypothetical protein KC357_g2157 [Hortaea werneckii]|nr:hypothetical protein KC357_g2157 [Hortaea werneckii]
MVQPFVIRFAFKTEAERDEIERRSKLVDLLPTEIDELAAHEKDLRLRYIKTSRDDFFEYLKTLPNVVPGRDGSHDLTDDTPLIPLWKPKKSEPFDRLLSNLSGVANTWQRCYLERPNGKLVPTPRSDFAFDRNDCNMFVSYRSLLYAPCVRLELRFYSGTSINGDERVRPFHKVKVDFHWANDSHHPGKRGVYDYAYSKDTNKYGHRVMSFKSDFATVSGLTIANHQLSDRIAEEGKQLLKLVDEMLEPTGSNLITLHCIQEAPRPKTVPQGDHDASETTWPTESHLITPHCSQEAPRPKTVPQGDHDASETTGPTESHLITPHCSQEARRPKTVAQGDQNVSEIIWPAKPDLLAVQAYLPGGDGFLLSSLFSLEYRETMYWWRTRIQNAMRRADNPRDTTHYPTVITVDSSQGSEALMTFLDLAVQKMDRQEDIGFVRAVSRVNVALTRGRGVVWTAGGSCESRWRKNIPAIAAFRNHCVEMGLRSVVQAPKVPDSKIPPQLLGSGYPAFGRLMAQNDQVNQADADDSSDDLEPLYGSERPLVK